MARKRRGNGEGSIFQRGDGRWTATITIGYHANGKRNRRTVYGKTRGEVQDKLTNLQHQKLNGTLGDVTKLTVAQYLDRWLDDSARLTVSPTTFDRYEGIVRNHIKPRIGGVKLAKLAPAHIQGMYSTMEKDGATAATLEHTHRVIRRALNVAVRWELVIRNACDPIDSPKATRKAIRPLTSEQAATLMREAESHRLHALFVLSVTTGMRQGELFGLKPEDIDGSMVHVRRTIQFRKGKLLVGPPKTAAGRRSIQLPQFAVDALHDHRRRMMAEGHAASEWLFCDTKGGPLRKSNFIRKDYKPLLKRAGLPSIRFHDLRHTMATLLLSLGEHPKVVQERLGHSKISMTLDTYSHVLPNMQREAASKLDQLFA
jgi:integrase